MIQILNARILTMKDRQTASCMCIEQGSIVYIGDHIPEEYKAADCVDMGGRVIIPGIIDAHSHLEYIPSGGFKQCKKLCGYSAHTN